VLMMTYRSGVRDISFGTPNTKRLA